MRDTLRRWVADAETRRNIADFELGTRLSQLDYLTDRSIDLYFSLVGELFDMLRAEVSEREEWLAVGNALATASRELTGATRLDAIFFAAVAFYTGGYPASAVMTIRDTEVGDWADTTRRACYELLARRGEPTTQAVQGLLAGLRSGAVDTIEEALDEADSKVQVALHVGPEEWVSARMYASLLGRFQRANLRSVLPDGGARRWDPLVASFLEGIQPVWEFFPSQIDAIQAGLLTNDAPYSLQMPTGAGKTALTETLIFSHLSTRPDDIAVLLVPYRALARELRYSVGRRLTRMGLQARAVYGGTVPTPEEGALEDVRVIIATPEALTGLIGSNPAVAAGISMVVCDEGHLLDSQSRGVGLELLLARLRVRTNPPRLIFLSAIVPNIEEINAWLGGGNETVIRSEYRPALAEYAVLRPTGSGATTSVALALQAASTATVAHTLPDFLDANDFRYFNASTNRHRTYPFTTMKTQAVATARKALPLGTVALFSTMKRGNQGVIGLAKEVINQVSLGLPLPTPQEYVIGADSITEAVDYLRRDFGEGWVGTRALDIGVAVHHGDLPQETREVLEELLAQRQVRMVVCTSTLAEGVNLPIRTLVLYTVHRRTGEKSMAPMLARDIKNLVGRAGRAGSTTRGLVVCVNPAQWQDVRPVAEGGPGEPVTGGLLTLLRRLERALTGAAALSNDNLESEPQVFTLVDGIDSTLVELLHDELGADEFRQLATSITEATFAASKSTSSQRALLNDVVRLRADRIMELEASGRLSWVRASGVRPRMIDAVSGDLRQRLNGEWSQFESVLDPILLDTVLAWAWEQPGFEQATAEAYARLEVENLHASLRVIVTSWLHGQTYAQMAVASGLEVDDLIRVHTKVVLYDLVTLVEQAVVVLQQQLNGEGISIAVVVQQLADYLRYGVGTDASRALMVAGMRHRRAAVQLGNVIEASRPESPFAAAADLARSLLEDEAIWGERLGRFVYLRSVGDLRRR